MITTEKIYKTLLVSKCYLSEDWKKRHAGFLQDEILYAFSKQLFFKLSSENDVIFLPIFEEEIFQDYAASLNFFKVILFDKNEFDLPKKMSQIIQKLPFKDILLIMGQRITSASVQDEKSIPPLETILLNSCFQMYNEEISLAVREWEKHVGRYEGSIFGTIKGNKKDKESTVRELINYFIEGKKWWNIFHHYKHGLVYEIRISKGQGMRWTSNGKQFIGFLEHFL